MPAPPPIDRVLTTVNAWKNKLLDLTKRNRALNFRVNTVSTVTVVDELPAEIFRLLCLERKPLKFAPTDLPEDEEEEFEPGLFEGSDTTPNTAADNETLFLPYEPASLATRHIDDVLQTNANSERLDKSLRRLDDQARSIRAEQGVNALYLALGMMHYADSKDSKVFFKAPLILVPVELERTNARDGYKVIATDEEIIANPSLAEYLSRDYRLKLPDLPDSASLADDYNLQNFFNEVLETVSEHKDWKVTNEIYLGLFSFQKLVMYKDLEKNVKTVGEHRIFQQIINKQGDTFIGLPEGIREIELDKHFAPENCIQVVDADSSQLRAIATVSQKYDLVLEGPPGTGKSQTITNLIAQALAAGKSVLFVAEKMAALDVVHRRLAEVGLGEFCLELHSTKANKQSVMQELRKTLDASIVRLQQTNTGTERLSQVRSILSNYVNAVHEHFGALDASPYQIYGELDKVRNAPKAIFRAPIEKVSSTDLADVFRNLGDLVAASKDIGQPSEHPWRDTSRTFYPSNVMDEISELCASLAQQLAELILEAEKLESVLGLPRLRKLAEIEPATRVASTLARSPGPPFTVLVSEAWNSAPSDALRCIAEGRRASDLKAKIETILTPDALELNPAEETEFVIQKLSGSFRIFAMFSGRFRAIRRRWRALRLPNNEASMQEQVGQMQTVSTYLDLRRFLNSQGQMGHDLFGSIWKGEESDWNALEYYISWVVEFRQLYIGKGLKEQVLSTAMTRNPDLTFLQILREKGVALETSLNKLAEILGLKNNYFADFEIADISIRVAGFQNNLNVAPQWAAFELGRQTVCGTFASEVLAWLWDGSIDFQDILPAFRRAFYQKWLTLVVEGRPELLAFNTVTHEQRLTEFRDLDARILVQNQRNLVGALRSQLQKGLQHDAIKGQMLTLRRELNKQRRIIPLRLLMKNCLEVVRTIKPCFMMSPLTVAQLLEADRAKFDLVLFDEASQLPTEDAVGSIIRGDQLVVVGDPKQLPPTNFFAVTTGQTNLELDEDGQPIFQDTESVLEEVQSSGVPSTRLKWHYRSSHESLITFSNAQFYDSELYTFPANETDSYQSGLRFEFVENGVYEGKGLNMVEARRVVDEIIHHAKYHSDKSLGVGTFNMRQQIAIQDELELRRRGNIQLEKFFDLGKDEPFFVKNLENIQGDERDVIFLSVTYGKAHDGILRHNFGPLNGENGWRRMNVLTTRARRMMKVFSSIKASDVHVRTDGSRGAILLRDFLAYAENRILDSPTLAAKANADSPFELEVFNELTHQGLSLEPQVGVSGYKIDFGIYDPEVEGRFVCGLECDGLSYHSSETARDRDRLRQQVLERRGWEIHRIWSTDWFKDRRGQIERILRLVEGSIERARRSQSEEDLLFAEGIEKPKDSLGIEVDPRNQNRLGIYDRPKLVRYTVAEPEMPRTYGYLLYASQEELKAVIMEVLDTEGPIHTKDLLTRVASAWGQKAGTQIAGRILLSVRQSPDIVSSEDFLFISGREVKARSRAGIKGISTRISPLEIRDAILTILQTEHRFIRSDLITEVRSVFGFARAGSALQKLIGDQIELLLEDGTLGEAGTGIGLCNQGA